MNYYVLISGIFLTASLIYNVVILSFAITRGYFGYAYASSLFAIVSLLLLIAMIISS